MQIKTRYINSQYIEIILKEDNTTIEISMLSPEQAQPYLDTFREIVSELEDFIEDK